MYKILVFIIFVCLSCVKQEKMDVNIATNKPTEKKVEKVYSVNADSKPAGYLYKYQWENSIGVERNNYFAYDLVGNPVGYVGDDGHTIKYYQEEKIPVGNFNLDIALKKIYNSSNIQYKAVLEKEVENTFLPKSRNKNVKENSDKATSKREQADVSEDEIYEDSKDEYSDDEYSNDEYSDDEYDDF